jgi:hypothetical protein
MVESFRSLQKFYREHINSRPKENNSPQRHGERVVEKLLRAGSVPARGNHRGLPYCELCVPVVKSFLDFCRAAICQKKSKPRSSHGRTTSSARFVEKAFAKTHLRRPSPHPTPVMPRSKRPYFGSCRNIGFHDARGIFGAATLSPEHLPHFASVARRIGRASLSRLQRGFDIHRPYSGSRQQSGGISSARFFQRRGSPIRNRPDSRPLAFSKLRCRSWHTRCQMSVKEKTERR